MTCTCHDPTVFGHLTCTRAETQPNNTPRHPSEPTRRIIASELLGMICNIHDEVLSIGELDAATRDTRRRVDDLTATLNYITRRYGDQSPPRH